LELETTMDKKEPIVAGAAVGLVIYTLILSMLGPIVSSALTNKTIANTGTVKAIGVGVYWDQACTNAVSSIAWGMLLPGGNVNKTVFIRNEGNAATALSMATSSWNPPETANFMILTWDYGGQTLNPSDIVQVKFTLTVNPNITGITSFSFVITIAANG